MYGDEAILTQKIDPFVAYTLRYKHNFSSSGSEIKTAHIYER